MNPLYGLLIVSLLLTGCASTSIETLDQQSGFIPKAYLSKMKHVKTSSHQRVYRYAKPGIRWQDFDRIIIDPVIAWPEPKPTKQVSQETLDKLQHRLTSVVKKAFANRIPLTTLPGEHTLRLQVVVSGIVVSNKGLAPYEFIPFSLVKAGITTAVGERDQEVKLYLENKITNSFTGELLFAGIREINGENLENTREQLQPKVLETGINITFQEIAHSMDTVFKTTQPKAQ